MAYLKIANHAVKEGNKNKNKYYGMD